MKHKEASKMKSSVQLSYDDTPSSKSWKQVKNNFLPQGHVEVLSKIEIKASNLQQTYLLRNIEI